ncbi:glycosyl transferase, group 2 family protein [Erythrobacter litoralis HTCC2594]|uniref:Glycosyl transferase, group 2 family protein n=2 Tax=Erythrobacter litoralis TaxID=39960 RepID=Q2N706_ERYLH|nr:glycosyl transferase, group 2 family protein [Erythrobacter litoralis HTCC2594]
MDSVLSQEGIDLQYIVCDAGSTDGSRAIIESYDDPRIISVFEEDAGPADGLNKGFARAKGSLFGYLNSDDLLLPGALTRVARFFAERPQIDVACGHAHAIDTEGHHLRRVWSEPYWPPAVARGAFIQIQPSTFFRADIFRKSGGFEIADRASWDAGLLARMYAAGAQFAVVDDFLSAYRLHGESITMSGRLAQRQTDNLQRRAPLLLGRDFRSGDIAIGHALRAIKHLRWPMRLLERVLRGPMAGRAE